MRFSRPGRRIAALDSGTAERMFADLSADDAPPGFAAVVDVLAAAAAPAPADGLAGGESGGLFGEPAAVAAYRSTVAEGLTVTPGRSATSLRSLGTRVGVLAAAGLITIGGGVAAAATGTLPAPVQRVAYHVLGGWGVPPAAGQVIPADRDHPDPQTTESPVLPAAVSAGLVPGAAHRPSTEPTSTETTETTETTEPTEPTEPTETTETTETTKPTETTETTEATRELAHESSEADRGEAVSSIAHSADPGPGHGAAVCKIASDGACRAAKHHEDQDGDRTAATAPDSDTPMSTTSRREDRHGSTVAATAHSVAPGPDHGPAVCSVASDGACPTDATRGRGTQDDPGPVHPQD